MLSTSNKHVKSLSFKPNFRPLTLVECSSLGGGYSATELVVTAELIFPNNHSVNASVLVDNGSRVEALVLSSLFPVPVLKDAKYPVNIRTADGSPMMGGSQGSFISIRIPIRDDFSDEVTYLQFDDLWVYSANITSEVIVGFPFLRKRNLSVDCGSVCLRSTPSNGGEAVRGSGSFSRRE